VRWAIFGSLNLGPTDEKLEAEEAEAWKVGGRLYTMKRKREKIAKRTLQHYQRQQDEQTESSSDGRLKRIENLVNDLLKFSEDQEREIHHLQKDLKKLHHTEEMETLSLRQGKGGGGGGGGAGGGAPPALQHGRTNREHGRELKHQAMRPEVRA
jgi:hypothetical protein